MNKRINTAVWTAIAILTAVLTIFNSFYPLDAFITDHLYSRLSSPSQNIVIIGIDEETLSEYGNFNLWSREKIAEMIDILEKDPDNRPLVIGIDLLMTDRVNESSDNALINSVADSSSDIVFAGNIVYRGSTETDAKGRIYYNPEHISDVEMPFDGLREVSGSGFTNAVIAPDGFVRYSMNSVIVSDSEYDSFDYAIYKLYVSKGGLGSSDNNIYTPPTDPNVRFRFCYSGRTGEFSHISLIDFIDGKVPAGTFKDAIVLVGAYAPGSMDSYRPASDRGTAMYGVEVHANIIQAYLMHKTAVDVNPILTALVSILLIMALYLITGSRPLRYGLIANGVAAFAWCIAGRLLLMIGRFLPCAYILVALLVASACLIIEKYVIESISRKRTLGVFKKYVSPSVVEELSKSGDFEVKLGGEKRDIAVLFVDIRGFTPLSESLDPEDVVDILNDYLKLVTDSIFKYNGTLDKFIGDAAMAVFNAPFDLDDYIFKAVLAACDIQKKAEPLEKELFDKYGKTVRFGIGVNAGPATVGNIGSDFRMDYTAIGDTVNTAARLESNAGPGQILISAYVREQLGSRINAESIGEIPLKGKSNRIEVFSVSSIQEAGGNV